jgi:hypothetical protein
MTYFEEKSLELVTTLIYYPGKTVDELKESVDWLKYISTEGITHYAMVGLKKGYIRERARKSDNKLVYYATAKGKRKVDY